MRAEGVWERVGRVLARLDAGREADRSFRDFLRTAKDIDDEDRDLAVGFVEGFNAADGALISERALAVAHGGTEGAARASRIREGYHRVVERLASGLEERIRLGVLVRSLEWRPGEVLVRALDAASNRDLPPLRARAAVVTVPLAVLQLPADDDDALRLLPDVREVREEASKLVMGSAVRIALLFRDRPWTGVAAAGPGTLERLGFLHTPEGPFDVWWTRFPDPAPLLVGWAGGPSAARLAGSSRETLAELALDQLGQALGLPRARLDASLEARHVHDWTRDPLTGGAYSYAAVGGADAGDALARPVAGTLFFAGEATAPAGQGGTVEAAIASGRRAAREVVSAFPRG